MAKIDFAFLPTTFIVYSILVHYRVGSLEMTKVPLNVCFLVHYRVGSLEKSPLDSHGQNPVHYRVGSLEIKNI